MTNKGATEISHCLRAQFRVQRRTQHRYTSSLAPFDSSTLHLVPQVIAIWVVHLVLWKQGNSAQNLTTESREISKKVKSVQRPPHTSLRYARATHFHSHSQRASVIATRQWHHLCVDFDRFWLCACSDRLGSVDTIMTVWALRCATMFKPRHLEKGQTIPSEKIPLFLDHDFLANGIDNPNSNFP
jgi:hypothetical protein